MKITATLALVFMLGASFAVADCEPVSDRALGNSFGVSEVESDARALAEERSLEEANRLCVGEVKALCGVQFGCSFGELTSGPNGKVRNTSCFYDDISRDWTCVADSESECAATCTE